MLNSQSYSYPVTINNTEPEDSDTSTDSSGETSSSDDKRKTSGSVNGANFNFTAFTLALFTASTITLIKKESVNESKFIIYFLSNKI